MDEDMNSMITPQALSKREKLLANEPIPKLVFQYSVPAIIGMLANALYNVVDRFWIGKMNDVNAMSGIGISASLSLILLGFMQLIGVGATASISIRLGQHRKADAERILANALTLCLIIGGSVSLICLYFLNPILTAFGASSQTLPYSRDYTQIILLGNMINTIGFSMNHSIRGSGNPMRSASTQLLGAVLNIFLDPLFIFTFHLGVKGAAIATVISQAISAAWVLSFYLTKRGIIHLKVSLMPLRIATVRQILSIGVSPFLLQVAASFVYIAANLALRTYGGDIAIGAMTVINSVSILFMMPLFGLNQGLQPILGYNYGAGQYDRVKAAWRFGVLLASGFVFAGFLVVQIFPAWIINQFISDPELTRIGTFGIRIFLSMLPVVGFQIISTNYFQSVGKAGYAVFASLLRQVIILLPLYLVLPSYFGLKGIWFAGPIADLLAFIITGGLMIRELRFLDQLNKVVNVGE